VEALATEAERVNIELKAIDDFQGCHSDPTRRHAADYQRAEITYAPMTSSGCRHLNTAEALAPVAMLTSSGEMVPGTGTDWALPAGSGLLLGRLRKKQPDHRPDSDFGFNG
jgi:hypothetical protein